jgi:eukaryotic-like serine/threonine-protein kinase
MIGQTISHYEILEKLGEGGMGIVYKAHDTKLDRTVALKFLPQNVSPSDEDKTRFIQEAKAAATLNHQNICTIHDIQEHENQLFIVMEYIDGQTLRDRTELQKDAPISLKQAIDIGIQISEGLAAAHESGIIHRDIKPENVMLKKDGRVVVMDFGLAKLRVSGVSRLTKEGSTVGTMGYMAPEQVQGLDVDHRADIFSLGVILYELFAGEAPFKGAHETAMAYEIVNVDPSPLTTLKPDIDPELDRIVLECIDKDKDERYQSAREVAKDLKRFKRESGRQRVSKVTSRYDVPVSSAAGQQNTRTDDLAAEVPVSKSKGINRPLVISIGVVALLLASILLLMLLRQQPVEVQKIRAYILPEPGSQLHFTGFDAGPVAVSPDGKMIAYTATNSEGRNVLWVRPLEEPHARQLRGTENAAYPLWSPDSRNIGFFSDEKIKYVAAAGGPTVIITDAAGGGRGGTWGIDGTILFTPAFNTPIHMVHASGGESKPITTIDTVRGETTHRWPSFLPDGKHFLYFVRVSGEQATEGDGVFVGSTDSDVKKMILRNSSHAIYASGHILFVRENMLMAQPFDTKRLEFSGEPFPVTEHVRVDVPFNLSVFSASQTGMLAYMQGEGVSGTDLALYDRRGNIIGTVGERAMFADPNISPDGSKVAVGIYDNQTRVYDIWIYDIQRGIRTRFTFDPVNEQFPLWTNDGRSIVYSKSKEGVETLVMKSSTGAGVEEILTQSNRLMIANAWSPDGKYLAYFTAGDPQTGFDSWILPIENGKDPYPFLRTQFNEGGPVFSPDGKWIAYASNESGRSEVYVRPFLEPGGKWQISTDGGSRPNWMSDGGEIIYITENGTIMSAEISIKESAIDVGTVRPLFETRASMYRKTYDVTPDGQLFVTDSLPEGDDDNEMITLIVNWDADVRK